MIVGTSLEDESLLKIHIDTTSDSFTIISSTSTKHRVIVPATSDFYYSIEASDLKKSGRITFPSPELKEFEFVVYGDTRYGTEVHEKIVEKTRKIPFAFVLGDLVSNGLNLSEWRTFLEIESKREGILFTARGNHDFGFLYNSFLYPDNYTVRIGNLRFIVLDSNSILFLKNLEDLFEKFKDERTFKVVMFHHVIFSCGPHGRDLDTLLRKRAHDIFKRYGVKIVLTSHDHNYQRLVKDGITYIVTGGGGAYLYRVDGSKGCGAKLVSYAVDRNYVLVKVEGYRLKFEVLNLEGKVLDEFEITFGGGSV